MKSFISLSLALFVLFFSNLQAQTKTEEERTVKNPDGTTTTVKSTVVSKSEHITERNNMININVIKVVFFYNLTYYQKVSPDITLGAGVEIPTFPGVSGFGINTEMRFHTSGKGMRGFYIAPNFAFTKTNGSGYAASAGSTSVGILLGWQWLPGDDFSIGFAFGVDKYLDTNPSDVAFYDSGTLPALRLEVGYAW